MRGLTLTVGFALVIAAAGLLGLLALAGRLSVTTEHPPEIAIALRQIQELNELTVLRVPVQFIHEARLQGQLGGIAVLLDVHGQVDLGIDMSKVELTDVDTASRTATLLLPPVHVVSSRIDLEATRIYRIDRWSLWRCVVGEAGSRQVVAEALSEAESLIRASDEGQAHAGQAEARARFVCSEAAARLAWALR